MRSFDYDHQDHGAIRLHMHETHLPLASQTQFVERGVKEAKYVSATDRSEEHRSSIAIVRSHTPLGKSKQDEDTSIVSSKVQALIESARSRASQHTLWQVNQEDMEHDQRINQIQHSLKQGHFKKERVDAKKSKVEEIGFKCKPLNAAQQAKPQTKTPEVSGLIPYGKLVQARNFDDLKRELEFRGIEPEDVPDLVSLRVKKLKELESKRLIEHDNMTPLDAAKHKAFKILSTAKFRLRD